MNRKTVLAEDENCWKVSESSHLSVIIDCENFYRAVYEAFVRAQKTIFIVGWDIDSRIRLLHNEDAERAEYPVLIRDLIKHKAEQNPQLQIYLVRWDSSLAFLSFREVWLQDVWQKGMPENVHIALDATIPVGGSHHQKLIVVDDELAFSGGMDIAVQRWDTRAHPPQSIEREDCCGAYPPYHDVQAIMTGAVVEHLAELVRWRWDRLVEEKAIGFVAADNQQSLPATWPPSVEPVMSQVRTAIARTIPDMGDTKTCQEVESMLISLIRQARRFIYIENQFVSYLPIAEALNIQLKNTPSLQVMIVSSYKPKGPAEQESYWAGRIEFEKLLLKGVDQDRVRLAYSSVIDESGERAYKLIHSKLLFVDDVYMVVGSANLNRRSMALDTECDVIVQAEEAEQRRAMARVRNDLLAEHCGESIETVEGFFQDDNPLAQLMQPSAQGVYELQAVQDQQFTDGTWKPLVDPILDPAEPIISGLNTLNGDSVAVRNPPHKWVIVMCLALFIGTVVALLAWGVQMLPEDFDRASLVNLLEEYSGNALWSLGLVIGVFVFTGFLFIPVTMVTLAVAAVYGPWFGAVYSIIGALASASLMFYVGQLLGNTGLRNLGGPRVQVVNEKLRNASVPGVAVLRMVPIAPYTFVNLVAGISSLRFYVFLLGSLMGLSPALLANSLVGDSLFQLFTDPTQEAVLYLAGGAVAWVVLLVAAHGLSRSGTS